MVSQGIWGSVLGRFVLGYRVLKWAGFVLSFSILEWTQLSEELGF